MVDSAGRLRQTEEATSEVETCNRRLRILRLKARRSEKLAKFAAPGKETTVRKFETMKLIKMIMNWLLPLAEAEAMLYNPWKYFQVTADTTNLLANDQVLGDLGKGRYAVTALSAAAADGSITLNDGISAVVNAAAIPVRAAAVTFPEVRKNEDRRWIVDYRGRGATMPIDVIDGTNCEIGIVVEFLGAA